MSYDIYFHSPSSPTPPPLLPPPPPLLPPPPPPPQPSPPLILVSLYAESNSMSLNPLFALKWFKALLKECSSAYATQLEGSLCSSIPSTLSGSDREGVPSFGMTASRATLASEMVRKKNRINNKEIAQF